ncbi:winged helix-turn-helix transcriptional regulator [Pseudochryseolinea flava]|uniref:Transcriptional regulator n=1 Tax=Pseudochryseolinea flava TaxID=2059302 RepID=A0A364XV79_9BACT|nr:helix-turn-helix domain-containing protein [Pseudochryseolinea flava]RAV98222.1 transcriptional regulator [Pseudochryseolinea flava]
MRKNSSTNTINEQHINQTCGIAYTLSVIDGRWKINILSFLLNQGRLRYSHLKSRLPGISERMLTANLKALEKDGLIARIHHTTVPPKVEYELTQLGLSFKKILVLMDEWGEAHRPHTSAQ